MPMMLFSSIVGFESQLQLLVGFTTFLDMKKTTRNALSFIYVIYSGVTFVFFWLFKLRTYFYMICNL